MLKQDQLEDLRKKLLKKGLPRRYVRRVIMEMSEHLEDSQTESAATEFPKEVLGDTDRLADTIFEKMKNSRFAGRHPILSFILLPVVTLACAVAASMVSIELLTDDAIQLSDEFIPYAYTFYYFVRYFLPISLALGVCYFARNSFCGFRWAFTACASLTILLLLSKVDMTPPIPGSPGTGTFMIGIGYPFGTLLSDLVLSEKIKCILEYYSGIWQMTPLLLFSVYFAVASFRQRRDCQI